MSSANGPITTPHFYLFQCQQVPESGKDQHKSVLNPNLIRLQIKLERNETPNCRSEIVDFPFKLLYCICYIICIDWHMIFGLEQEGGSLIALMALAQPLHPILNRSRNKRRNLWVRRCVSSWWHWFPSRSSVLIYIYICAFLIWVLLQDVYIYTTGVSFSIGEAAPHHVL